MFLKTRFEKEKAPRAWDAGASSRLFGLVGFPIVFSLYDFRSRVKGKILKHTFQLCLSYPGRTRRCAA
jgi:hypothetical protein